MRDHPLQYHKDICDKVGVSWIVNSANPSHVIFVYTPLLSLSWHLQMSTVRVIKTVSFGNILLSFLIKFMDLKLCFISLFWNLHYMSNSILIDDRILGSRLHLYCGRNIYSWNSEIYDGIHIWILFFTKNKSIPNLVSSGAWEMRQNICVMMNKNVKKSKS